MKILVLTRNHPVQIVDVVSRIYNTVIGNNYKNAICISPQVAAMMVQESKGVPYQQAYYPALQAFEDKKDTYAAAAKHFIVVGTVPNDSKTWYDAIVALDDAESIKDYSDFDNDFNTRHYTMCNIADGDILFKHFDELRYFLVKMIQEKKDGV
jgi:hypothetical protein